MTLSIIIPVFNAEKYLKRCLESVFTAIVFAPKTKTEVILVDNNSEDKSLDIAQEFVKKSPLNIKILHCRARGASAARNYGAKKAGGKYIWFIDADDTISQDSILLLSAKAEEEKSELTMLGAERIYQDSHTDYLSAIDPKSREWKSRFVRYGAGPWQFLILKKWWEENKFVFREGIIHEDMEMVSSFVLYLHKFASVDKPLYHYYQNDDSVLHKNKWDPHYLDIFEALEGLHHRFSKANALREYHDELEWFFVWNLLIDSNKDFKKFKEGRIGLKKSREILKKYYKNWRKNKFLKSKPLKLKLKVRLNYYGF